MIGMGETGAILFLFAIILAVLWFLLPFAVFGIKARLDTSIQLQREIVNLLRYGPDGKPPSQP